MPTPSSDEFPERSPWHTFEDILHRLHQEGIWLHPDQLAEFFVMHGLPVDVRYVPERLQEKATSINENYLGDMAQIEPIAEDPWYSYPLL
jgi:hypothetical protein